MKNNKPLIILGIAFLVLFLSEFFAPKPIDWTINLTSQSKQPYGTYVLRRILPDLFPKRKLWDNKRSLYLTFKNDSLKGNLIIIDRNFSPTEPDVEKLLNFVKAGSRVFIAAHHFGSRLNDTLKLSTTYEYPPDSLYAVNFANSWLQADYDYQYLDLENFYFDEFDTLQTKVLNSKNDKYCNFIQVKYGKGHFFLNINPLAFTNFYILKKPKQEYVQKALSYLKDGDIIWDDYYKPFKKSTGTPIIFILRNNSLKAAYFLAIAGILLYLFFESKRRQRIIPVVKPPANASLEFVKTLGSLYLQKRNNKDMALKKINFFLEHLRKNYFLHINNLYAVDYKAIADKTGRKETLIQNIFERARIIDAKNKLSDNELLQFNALIEKFFREE